MEELYFIFGCKTYMYEAGGEATQILMGDEVDLHRGLSLQLEITRETARGWT